MFSNLRTYAGKVFVCVIKGFPMRMVLCDVELDRIPSSTQFGHPIGIIIQRDTKLGENCKIGQNVTIGQRWSGDKPATIGNNVTICANALILGEVTIGDNSVIGAGAIVIEDVPKDSVYICKVSPMIKKNEKGV